VIWLVYALLAVHVLGALCAFALPFVVKARKGPLAASFASKVCTGVTFGGAIAAIVTARFAAGPGPGRLLLFVVPLTLVTGASCAYWTVVGLMNSSRKALERASKERQRRALARSREG
jgi:hypothetical protein